MSKPQPSSAVAEADEETGQTGGLRSPLNDLTTFLVRLAQLRSFDEFQKQFARFDVTPAQFSAFALIVANPGIRPSAIAEDLRIKSPNVAVLVNSLVGAGLVERTQDATELRASLLHATPVGMAAWPQMKRAADEVEASFVNGLSPDEARQLSALLRKLLHR